MVKIRLHLLFNIMAVLYETLLSIRGKVFNTVLLNRLKDAVDPHLRDHQAGFRKNRSCADQVVTAHHLGAAIGMELVTLRQFN